MSGVEISWDEVDRLTTALEQMESEFDEGQRRTLMTVFEVAGNALAQVNTAERFGAIWVPGTGDGVRPREALKVAYSVEPTLAPEPHGNGGGDGKCDCGCARALPAD